MKLLLPTIALFALFNVKGAFGANECGKVLLNSVKSNGNGGSTLEGQWPWQVALYQKVSGKDPRFICGGTLVSNRHVITAGHCAITRTGSTNINLTVYLGKNNLMDTGENVQVSTVKKIRLHPEYNQTSFLKDLAILELQDPVTFTDWVQPACLWPDYEIERKKIVGETGSVVSWAMDDTNLRLLEMPVVSQEACIRSYPEFFVRFTSASTYCAGSGDACTGHSGFGMVFEKDGSWYLRGVVSLMVAMENQLRCDPTYYTIFADVAQALPWIKENIMSPVLGKGLSFLLPTSISFSIFGHAKLGKLIQIDAPPH